MVCPTCHFQENWDSRSSCRNCGAPRPKAAAAKNGGNELQKALKQLEQEKRANQNLRNQNQKLKNGAEGKETEETAVDSPDVLKKARNLLQEKRKLLVGMPQKYLDQVDADLEDLAKRIDGSVPPQKAHKQVDQQRSKVKEILRKKNLQLEKYQEQLAKTAQLAADTVAEIATQEVLLVELDKEFLRTAHQTVPPDQSITMVAGFTEAEVESLPAESQAAFRHVLQLQQQRAAAAAAASAARAEPAEPPATQPATQPAEPPAAPQASQHQPDCQAPCGL